MFWNKKPDITEPVISLLNLLEDYEGWEIIFDEGRYVGDMRLAKTSDHYSLCFGKSTIKVNYYDNKKVFIYNLDWATEDELKVLNKPVKQLIELHIATTKAKSRANFTKGLYDNYL